MYLDQCEGGLEESSEVRRQGLKQPVGAGLYLLRNRETALCTVSVVGVSYAACTLQSASTAEVVEKHEHSCFDRSCIASFPLPTLPTFDLCCSSVFDSCCTLHCRT